MAYTNGQRHDIMSCIKRLNRREGEALTRVPLSSPEVRWAIRGWYYERWRYLLQEYEKVLPHVEEIP